MKNLLEGNNVEIILSINPNPDGWTMGHLHSAYVHQHTKTPQRRRTVGQTKLPHTTPKNIPKNLKTCQAQFPQCLLLHLDERTKLGFRSLHDDLLRNHFKHLKDLETLNPLLFTKVFCHIILRGRRKVDPTQWIWNSRSKIIFEFSSNFVNHIQAGKLSRTAWSLQEQSVLKGDMDTFLSLSCLYDSFEIDRRRDFIFSIQFQMLWALQNNWGILFEGF